MTDFMTGGEFQTVREFLGLTTPALAEVLRNERGGPVNPKSIRAWESGKEIVPDDIREQMERIEAETGYAVGMLVDALNDASDVGVIVYRTDAELRAAMPVASNFTARWWRHVVARAALEVPGLEITNAE